MFSKFLFFLFIFIFQPAAQLSIELDQPSSAYLSSKSNAVAERIFIKEKLCNIYSRFSFPFGKDDDEYLADFHLVCGLDPLTNQLTSLETSPLLFHAEIFNKLDKDEIKNLMLTIWLPTSMAGNL